MITWITDKNGVEWVTDENGNKCSVRYFGNKENAEKALGSLKKCKNCTNCSDCSRCEKLEAVKDKEGIKPSWQVPVIENIHHKVLDAVSKDGAFDMSDWHTCDTTHCRAGWVMHLAGEAGYALEKFHTNSWHKGTALAASLIYHASCPQIPVGMPRFYEDNETAMADIKRCAEEEAI